MKAGIQILKAMIFEENRDKFLLSTDKAKLDINLIHNYLCNHSYWAAGISFDTVKRSIENSVCFGIYEGQKQIGFARVITDKATIAYLGDVFILQPYRGDGLAKWLMESVLKHPELQGFRRWLLLTKDAHGLYKQHGFTEIHDPEKFLEIWNPDVYKMQN